MKWFYWTLIFLAFCVPILYLGKGIDHLDIMKDRYKRALDAGASAAARAFAYSDEYGLAQTAAGFGIAYEHTRNIPINKENALIWFYRVFFRNMGMEEDEEAQASMRKTIPMKVIAGFDRLMIADVNDQWVFEKKYEFEYRGDVYQFTLSDQVMNKSTGVWAKDLDYGILPEERVELVNRFIRNSLNDFINSRQNQESDYAYDINISTNEWDQITENISSVSFIVMAEGLPLASLNPVKTDRYFAFAMGGTEIGRE